jgi:heat-inducible transcriptional repressor
LNDRQNALLKAIVENYIKDAKPVGSKSLCKKFKCSSATIRNEMSDLERLGYIEKNHISSGRVPSEDGYKYYVENLMKPKELTGDDVLKLQTIFSNKQLEVSDAINKCVEIISDITNYTSIILGSTSKDNTLQHVSIIPLQDNKIVALVCTNKGIVENKQFTLPEDTLIDEVVKTSEIINKMLIGTPINEVSSRLEFEIKPIIAKKVHQYQQVYSIFYDAFNDFVKNTTNVHLSGQSNLLKQPEYQDTDDVKRLIQKFEDKKLINKIEAKENGINVYIGEDNEFDNDVTVINTTYHVNGSEGTIAVIGPKRMEYAKVIGLLQFLNDNLQDKKKGGNNEK